MSKFVFLTSGDFRYFTTISIEEHSVRCGPERRKLTTHKFYLLVVKMVLTARPGLHFDFQAPRGMVSGERTWVYLVDLGGLG